MAIKVSRGAALLATVAAFSMAATPAMADGWGGRGGWGGRHHDDIDAGDVLTGILIIGGIAAIASAATSGSSHRNRDTQQQRDYRRDRDYRDQSQDSTGYGRDDRPEWRGGSSNIDSAVNTCTSEIERGSRRVDTVDAVSREGQGWRIAGQTSSGEPFACSVDGSGQIRSVSVNGGAA